MLRTVALFPKNWFIIVPLLLISGVQWAILFHVCPDVYFKRGLAVCFLNAVQYFNREYPPSAHDTTLLPMGASSNKSSQFGLMWSTCTVSMLGLLPALT